MRINKKFLQFIAALMILLFHLGIPMGKFDLFLFRIGYVGVDVFFFLAAYSLADRHIDYVRFLKNRFCNIYLKFLVFVVIAAIYKGMGVIRTVKVLTFVEFFEKGGGSFFWFVPAIMLFYLMFPFFCKVESIELLDNLIENAIRYNVTGGKVEVEVYKEENNPRLLVKDTGIGIPEADRERIFERFYRVDKSRSRETGGTGLGLSIVKHIVELHDGEIVLDSKVNEGTSILVKF